MDATQRDWVLHVDLDQFIAAVEVLRHPELAGKPLIVGGRGDPTERAVVSTASYEARVFGVGSGMPLRIAARKAPDAVILPVDAEAYTAASTEVMAALRAQLGAVVQVLGWDEAFVGIRSDDPEAYAGRVQQAVLDRTRLHCSIGVGDTLVRAKVATGFGKPRGVFRLTAENWLDVMGELPTIELWGVGPKVSKRLAARDIRTVADLAAVDPAVLADEFGPRMGPWYGELGRGEGASVVDDTPWVARGHSRETTFQQDLTEPAEIEAALRELVTKVLADVAAEGRPVIGLTLKVRYAPFFTKDGYRADGIFQVNWIFSNRAPTAQGGARIVTVDSHFLQQVEQNPYGISPSDAPIETLRIVFSSGTTGTPNAISLGRAMEQSLEYAMTSWFQGAPNLILMDTGTAWGIGEFYIHVRGGRPFLCAGGAAQNAIVRLAAENSVRTLKGSPAQIAALVGELEAQQRTLPSIQTVIVAGTVMPPGVAERMRRAAEGCSIFGNYGSTEAGGAASRLYESDDPFDAGHMVPGSAVEIVDEADQPVPDGEVGRIRHRGPGMAHGYLGNPEATARAFSNGWFYPGDMGFIRPDGGLTLTGRESELINAGGVKVDPNRLDHVALRHPKVMDACSFDYQASSGVRQIGIALVTEDDVDVEALVARLKAEFGTAAPTLVARIDSIPRTATGKPMRRTLAEKYKES